MVDSYCQFLAHCFFPRRFTIFQTISRNNANKGFFRTPSSIFEVAYVFSIRFFLHLPTFLVRFWFVKRLPSNEEIYYITFALFLIHLVISNTTVNIWLAFFSIAKAIIFTALLRGTIWLLNVVFFVLRAIFGLQCKADHVLHRLLGMISTPQNIGNHHNWISSLTPLWLKKATQLVGFGRLSLILSLRCKRCEKVKCLFQFFLILQPNHFESFHINFIHNNHHHRIFYRIVSAKRIYTYYFSTNFFTQNRTLTELCHGATNF